jgi:DNA-3-methyladenine glycosylase
MKLGSSFYLRKDVVKVARELLGKVLCTDIGGCYCSGMIVETEAYAGVTDKASHAFGGRNTSRTRTMFGEGGTAYIYLCYGIHHLFNVVTNLEGTPHAVLVRAIEPLEGVEYMLQRRGKRTPDTTLTSGPGSLSQALGIHYHDSGASLCGDKIWIEDRGINVKAPEIIASPRVGVAYAKEDALLPYRFRIRNNRWTSPAK